MYIGGGEEPDHPMELEWIAEIADQEEESSFQRC
jgi:hypothetical protein